MLDPIKTTEAIKNRYLAYLSTTFQIKDVYLQRQFKERLQAGELAKGPILEATPPFVTGKSLNELIDEGTLSEEFRRLESKELPLGRPLYKHQEAAIQRVVRENRNIVVATGTGSGKTEAFLVPILNHLFRQKKGGKLTPGVRTLLLYPMNALANDQLKRMRLLLKHYPDITFGRYTGETEKKEKVAQDEYRKVYGEDPLSNELLSRQRMTETPPHILLTNYAMLEYLMLRPQDHIFFDGEYATEWKFIVIDEAHTYTGAKGIEMAMLLRRLKDRVVQSEPNRLRCIATSATLGKGKEDFPDVAEFVNKLFGEEFGPQDIIGAVRKPISEIGNPWGKPDPSLYKEWQGIINENPSLPTLIEIGKRHDVPNEILEEAKVKSKDKWQFLYYILRGDERLISLRRLLEKEPQFINRAAEKIFQNMPDSKNALIALVNLAVYGKPPEGGQPLLPARYHFFVRAVEGAYLSLCPQKEIFLTRREKVNYNGREYPVFEMAVCRRCGATYLVGETQNNYFKQAGEKYFEDPNNLEYCLLLDKESLPVDNEDEEEVEELKGERYILCGACGVIDKANLVTPLCHCGEENYFELLRVIPKNGDIHKCPACTRTNPKGSLVWRFLFGKDAIATVLSTSLYQQLLPRNEDLRQLLIFSDSRQDAAFFAPYLNRTYSQILRRSLILKVVEENTKKVIENRWRVQDLIPPLKQKVKQLNLFPKEGWQGLENEVWRWVLHELLSIDPKINLEGLGCLCFFVVKPDGWIPPKPLIEDWKLSEDEVWILFQILVGSFRKTGAITFPDNLFPEDEFFQPKNHECYFREHGSSSKKHIKSWIPSSINASNSRLNFIERLAQEIGIDTSECREILGKIWQEGFGNPSSCWKDHFFSINLRGEGTVYRLRYNFWEIQLAKDIRWYYCEKCNNMTCFNLRGVCPTYRCSGKLIECNPFEIFAENHYRRLYLESLPLRMEAKEHTAQLRSEAAAEVQRQFIKGEVNILSCSTTFELGVDIGDLESVFMRNVPPSPANYLQRAGRAGRRTDSAAFALTFCQRRSYDLAHFGNPLQMVSGKIQPPHFELKNEKIVRRHIYATALTEFWRGHQEMSEDVESFFFRGEKSGTELFMEYLESKPDNLYNALKRIVPKDLHQKLELGTWGWISGLFDKEEGVLLKAEEEVKSDVESLEEFQRQLISKNKPSDYIIYIIKTIKKRPKGYLINFLSSRNVIPKYGFPVDVVELEILHHSEEAKRLELNRDLRIALSEYAPSSQIVAGGMLWTSRYLKRLSQREWRKYRYAICDYCQCYQSVLEDSGRSLDTCNACGKPLQGRNKGVFVKPEFGFIAENKLPLKPGEKQPEKTYTTRSYYSGESKERDRLMVSLSNGVSLIAIPASDGKMAVINDAGHRRFKICHKCGYTILGNEKEANRHNTHWNKNSKEPDCSGKLYGGLALGHEYFTDILQLRFEGYVNNNRGFWSSLLYALLEGAGKALDIERKDLDGCLYSYGDAPTLILFDDVPGGAGHVQRIAENETRLISVLESTLQRMKGCECDTSCCGCLRNYRNQFCHSELNRRGVIEFLEKVLS